MRTVMASLYGKLDIRLREVELPELKDDEILLRVVTNSLCPSTYKAAELGSDHLRVPDNIAEVPVVTGHELAGVIEKVGPKWQDRYHVGQHATIHSGLRVKGSEKAPGYSYEFFGGNALYCIIPGDYIEYGGVLTFDEDYFAFASLLEPLTCDIGAFHTLYHERMQEYPLYPGNKEGGRMALMASCGAMGLGCIDYAVHGPRRPSLLVVTDVNQERIDHAARLLTVEDAKANGVELHYLNMNDCGDEYDALMGLTEGKGFDDTIVFALSAHVLELANRTLAYNGCMDFFAGPIDTQFSAQVNYSTTARPISWATAAATTTTSWRPCAAASRDGCIPSTWSRTCSASGRSPRR